MTDAAVALALPLVARFEGFRRYAYPDPASKLARATVARWGLEPADQIFDKLPSDLRMLPGDPWTCGYGKTSGVTPATEFTLTEAQAHLRVELAMSCKNVREKLTRSASANELAAMTSLAYNIGLGRFGGSTLLKKFNAGDRAGAADEFLVWRKAGGQVMKGLETRRKAERELFLGAVS